MKRISLLLLLSRCFFSFGQDPMLDETVDLFRQFAKAIEANDKEAVAKMIHYPLKRENPIPDILDADDLIDHYDRIFDTHFREMLITAVSNEELDIINRSGSTGHVGFLNGRIWLIYGAKEGALTTINYQSAEEKELAAELDRSVCSLLPEKLTNFERNVYMGASDSHVIRVDEIEGGYRYTSWSVGVSCQDEPDLIIEKGTMLPQGSAGGVWYAFSNGNYRYYFKRVRMAETAEQTGEFLSVEKDGKEIATWKLSEIYNQLEFISSN